MQTTRKITVFNTQSNTPSEFMSDAVTYGEIKNQISSVNGMKVVIRETKVTLEDDGAILPSGDFTIFLFPEKVKSGISADEYSVEDSELAQMLADIANNQQRAISILDSKIEQVFSILRATGNTLASTPAQRQALEEQTARISALANEASSFKF
jgi:hypothetical protein